MPDLDTQTPAATAVADPPAVASPESTAPAASPQVGSPTSFDAIFAQALAGIPKDDPTDAALGGTTPPADTTPATAQDAKSASEPPAERVSASETPGESAAGAEPSPEDAEASSRRKQIGADKDAEIARLRADLAARDPETLKASLREQVRAEYEAEQTRKATEAVDEDYLGNQERYERLLTVPDAEISADDYQWREERKERRRVHAPVERHLRSVYEGRLSAARASDQTTVSGRLDEVMSRVGEQIGDMATLPGVDSSSWKTPGKTFADYGRSLYDGGKATGAAEKETELTGRVQKAESEAARLLKDNQDLRLQIMGATPAPMVAGRSAPGTPGRPQANPAGSWEDNLGAAFNWGSTTH